MIPEIDEILRGLAAGTYTVAQAQTWIDTHMRIAADALPESPPVMWQYRIPGGVWAECDEEFTTMNATRGVFLFRALFAIDLVSDAIDAARTASRGEKGGEG